MGINTSLEIMDQLFGVEALDTGRAGNVAGRIIIPELF